MKKMMILMLCVMLVGSIAVTGNAAGATLSMTDVELKPGETVYVSVALNDAVLGDSVGISYSYDSSVLKAVPDASTWSISGVLQAFDRYNNGVWATQSPVNLKGNLCVLAFEVKDNVTLTETSISCTVKVKNGAADVGSYSAEATVTQVCDHEYGQWSDAGIAGHSRTCSNCQNEEVESHSWDEGKLTDKPNDPNTDLMIYTCTVCGGTKQIEVPGSDVTHPTDPTRPTEPDPTKPESMPTFPTKPTDPPEQPTLPEVTKPSEPHRPEENNPNPDNNSNPSQDTPTTPTQPAKDTPQETTAPPYKDYNQVEQKEETTAAGTGNGSQEDHSVHDRAEDVHPIAIPTDPDNKETIPAEQEESLTETHSHAASEANETSVATIIAVAVTATVLICAGVLVYWKKKR